MTIREVDNRSTAEVISYLEDRVTAMRRGIKDFAAQYCRLMAENTALQAEVKRLKAKYESTTLPAL